MFKNEGLLSKQMCTVDGSLAQDDQTLTNCMGIIYQYPSELCPLVDAFPGFKKFKFHLQVPKFFIV